MRYLWLFFLAASLAASAAPGASMGPSEGTIPLVVKFESAAAAGARWTFGDGQESTEANVSHTYTRIGRYAVRQTVGGKLAYSGEVRARLEKSVTVAVNGGGAEVAFEAHRGQKLRITMRAQSNAMEPYGSLESSSGSNYRPPNETAQNGRNTWEGTMTDDGRHVLTVFDGTNQGGTVTVSIEEP